MLLEVIKSLKKVVEVSRKLFYESLTIIIIWYLTDEVAILSLFDEDVDQETNVKMMANLAKENFVFDSLETIL